MSKPMIYDMRMWQQGVKSYLNRAHPSPRVLGYKRGSDINIKEGDIIEVRVYPHRRSGLMGNEISYKTHLPLQQISINHNNCQFPNISLDIDNQNLSVSKSDWLHVVIFQVSSLIRGIFHRFSPNDRFF
jgi:hypothetical protein